MDNFLVGTLAGIAVGTVAIHVVAFSLLTRLKRASKVIQTKEQEIMLLTYLLDRSKNRLSETTTCAQDMYKALHQASYYCDDKYVNTDKIEQIAERFKQIEAKNAAINT